MKMIPESQPLVSVITPVYNMGQFLPECIESILMQTYKNFEYIIVNNCSTDNTLEIASAYAKKDSRVRVHTNNRFVGVIENHNIAFSLISPGAKYCKVVSADDFIFPDFIMRTVEVAEENPSVGIVGSYQLSGSIVKWQGFPYPKAVLPGREICRRIFLGGDPTFGFGTPTSLLYRADLVRKSDEFYPNPSPHADTSACFKCLQESDFGFVYQVLSYERIHGETQSSKSADINRYAPAYLNDIIQYGPFYLTKQEFERKLKEDLNGYHGFLAVNMIRFRGKEFWDYHKGRLEELGHPVNFFELLRALVIKALRELLNPEQAIRKFRRHSVS
ncbi:MAG: glycosyltransferase family 2 protein [Thermodesulfobacteriota bacterium]|jgi:glycosyltransferase involved in cell wall biosynthesis